MEQNFDIAVIARQYEEIWRDVLAEQRQASGLEPRA